MTQPILKNCSFEQIKSQTLANFYKKKFGFKVIYLKFKPFKIN